jgi:hypothetical protein
MSPEPRHQGLPLLVLEDRALSQVWRLEVRAFKRHLKDDWQVTTWGNLKATFPSILESALSKVRYTIPTSDSNRNRWPDHPLWQTARAAISQDMEDLRSIADPDLIKSISREERDQILDNQIKGCVISRAALNEVSDGDLPTYVKKMNAQMERDIAFDKKRTEAKLAAARVKYSD